MLWLLVWQHFVWPWNPHFCFFWNLSPTLFPGGVGIDGFLLLMSFGLSTNPEHLHLHCFICYGLSFIFIFWLCLLYYLDANILKYLDHVETGQKKKSQTLCLEQLYCCLFQPLYSCTWPNMWVIYSIQPSGDLRVTLF